MNPLPLIRFALFLTLATITALAGPADPSSKQTTAADAPSEWKSLFDGHSLQGWKVTDFAGHGEVRVTDGRLVVEMGSILTGVNYTNPTPRQNYEIELEAMKLDGGDFFCGLTFPVRGTNCTFVVGGWGGGVVGISSIDGMDASENRTVSYRQFDKNRWYRIRVRVTGSAMQAWIDDKNVVDQPIADHKLGMRSGEIELSGPLGLATYQTSAAYRNIRLRRLPSSP